MDIITLELFDLTVSQAVLEVQRVLDDHPGSAVRIELDDETHRHNVVKLLDKRGRDFTASSQGPLVTIDVKAAKTSTVLKPAQVIPLEPKPAPIQPALVLSGAIGTGDQLTGRRLLLDILRRADRHIPWIGIAHEGASLLKDPSSLKTLQGLLASGVSIRVSRECMMFYPEEASGFEVMEDSEWQTLLLKGKATKI